MTTNNHTYNPSNEPVLDYAPGSKERAELILALKDVRSKVIDIPMVIGGEKIFTEKKFPITPPHDHKHLLAEFSHGEAKHVEQAIHAALSTKKSWEAKTVEDKAKIFLKAADLITGKYRAKINAATMLGQSKNVYQAEIDSACEMADFLRFNVKYLYELLKIQPASSQGVINKMHYRPLEGFVFALTPFNFTAIAGNLPMAPALLGNTVVWKPAFTQIYSAYALMEIFTEAGLPPGVINLIYTDGPLTGEIIFKDRDFAGIHFTGSTHVFQNIWRQIGENISYYKSYPRIVGETGGKDFIIAHPDCDVKALAVAMVRGAFEYQGQKCSAASRAYIPESIWEELKTEMFAMLSQIKMGPVEDFSNFINAVIDEKSFNKIAGYIKKVKQATNAEIIWGGKYDKSTGYYIEPTIILTSDPYYTTMCEEIFGPVLTVHVYKDSKFEDILQIADKTSPYALTGAIFSRQRSAVELASKILRHAAGNFYINDKPTGAVVNQQPFGGARGSGTNDKAGSIFNLIRWTSVQTIKENLNPPTDYRYPFMAK